MAILEFDKIDRNTWPQPEPDLADDLEAALSLASDESSRDHITTQREPSFLVQTCAIKTKEHGTAAAIKTPSPCSLAPQAQNTSTFSDEDRDSPGANSTASSVTAHIMAEGGDLKRHKADDNIIRSHAIEADNDRGGSSPSEGERLHVTWAVGYDKRFQGVDHIPSHHT